MHDLVDLIEQWRAYQAVALATVVTVGGSAPRPLGAKMAISADGRFAGSVSGGCIESDVIEHALSVISTGMPCLVHYGISDQSAWNVGLMCGGQIDIFIERLDERFGDIVRLCQTGKTFHVFTVIKGALMGHKTACERRQTFPLPLSDAGEIFAETIFPPADLFIIGASHIAIALLSIAKTLGGRVTIIDPRSAFATPERFAKADSLIINYPQRVLTPEMLSGSSAVVVLAHDPKVDDPALKIALSSEAGYIGALGSSRTHAERLVRLRSAGLTDKQLARIHAPIGVNIGASTPEEIALAIAAQIVAVRRRTYN